MIVRGPEIDVFNPARFDGHNTTAITTLSAMSTEKRHKCPGEDSYAFQGGVCSVLRGEQVLWYVSWCGVWGPMVEREVCSGCMVVVAQRWRIELKEGWTNEKAWKAIDNSITIITMVPPKEVPLVFKRRY